MKKIILIVVLFVIAIGVFFVSTQNTEDSEIQNEMVDGVLYENTDPDFSFRYDGSENGYDVLSPKPDNSDAGGSEKSFVLINKREHEELLSSEDAREGPPTINVIYFKNSEGLTSQQWVEQGAGFTDFNERRLTDITETTVGGVSAVEFVSDGLYASRVVVFGNQGRMFVLIGSFITDSDKIYSDFDVLRDSFRFKGT